MLGFEFLDKRPIIIAIAGSNGAGKSTFFASHLADCGLHFVNAVDPLEMIRYLEDAGCYLDLEPFFMDCFNRIRHELVHPNVLAAPFTFGVDVDELTDAAQAAINEMNRRLNELDKNSKEWERLTREIRFSKAVLARDYHDFGEANRFLSSYLIEISDDPSSESKIQADFLRSNYDFPFVPRGEE